MPQPVDPVAEAAAQLRQERLAALRTTLAPLQAEAGRLSDAAQAAAASDAVTEHPWDGPNQEFTAWQAVVQAYDACTAKLETEAAALFGPGSEEPEVRRLQRDIDKASSQALDRASRAADNILAAFAQTYHKAFVELDLKGAGFDSYTQLADQCRALHEQWQDAPLRPRMPRLEGRMAQYEAYEKACRAKAEDPDGEAHVPDQAELLYEAATLSRRAFAGAQSALDDRLRAFHRACTKDRSEILEEAVCHELEAVRDLHREQGDELVRALQRGAEIAAVCDTLLTGDPLQQARRPGPADEPWSAQRGHDQFLIEDAHEAIDIARTQREQSLKLPAHDVPQRAVHEQQAGWAVLRQVELTARTAANALECFHALSETLGTTPPDARPGLVRKHAQTLEQHASELLKALRDRYDLAGKVRAPVLLGLMDVSHTRLRADLRTTERMQVALAALEALLEQRVSAQQVRRRIEQCSLADLACPEPSGSAYDAIAEALSAGMKPVQQRMQQEKKWISDEAWQAESALHDRITSTLKERITCESILIQGQLLLAWAARAREPGSNHLDRPEDLQALVARVATLTQVLATEINKALKLRAASPEHGDEYRAQLDANKLVQGDLLHLLVDLRKRSAAAEATAGGSRQAEVPAAQPAGPEAREGRSSRRARTGQR